MKLYEILIDHFKWRRIGLIYAILNVLMLSGNYENIIIMVAVYVILNLTVSVCFLHLIFFGSQFRDTEWWLFSYAILDSKILTDPSYKLEITKWCEENCNKGWKFWNDQYILFRDSKDAMAFKLVWS